MRTAGDEPSGRWLIYLAVATSTESLKIIDPRDVLRRHGLRANKALGQNFLTDASALGAVLDAAELESEDRVLEIGPGAGTLTAELVQRAGCVLAIELDETLVGVVRMELGDRPNLHIAHGDILKVPYQRMLADACGAGSYKVVANLPYYITSQVLRLLLEREPKPELIDVMVQKEVAERATAGPGAMSLLGLSVQTFSQAWLVAHVPAGSFVPQPEVDSAVLQLKVRPEPLFPEISMERYFAIAAAGFGQKRKGLLNSLSSNLHLSKPVVQEALRAAGIEPLTRAQQLGLEDWARLCDTLPLA